MAGESKGGENRKDTGKDIGLAVVFGTGPVGLAVAQELLGQGREILMLSRSGKLPDHFVEGLGDGARARLRTDRVDALDAGAVLAATKGASTVFHCINTPYQDWHRTLESIQDNLVEAAIARNATLAVADNLYMYSRGIGRMDESSPREPPSRKGRLRERLHTRLLEAARLRGLRFTAIRASDFYGPWATWQSSLGTDRFLDPIFAGKVPALLGDPEALHSYSYVGDFGRALVFASGDERALGQAWLLPNDSARTSADTARLFLAAAGAGNKVGRVPKAALYFLGLFNPLIRELLEVLYQKEETYIADGSRFASTFGFTPTRLEEGVRLTLAWYRSRRGASAALRSAASFRLFNELD